GTRLGFDGPKGSYPIAPVTQKSLFQLYAEKILALQRRLRRSLRWFLMTSPSNHKQTQHFFRNHNYFGLNPADISFHAQAMLPVVDPRRGKILLRSKCEIALSPNGHGGAVQIIQSLGDTLRELGIVYLFTHQVDNPMVRMCDPIFIGYHRLQNSHFSSKAVAKADADERVGVFCRSGKKLVLVEYSELGEREKHAQDPDGRLSFRAGNIAQHVISVSLLCPEDQAPSFVMPYHVAHKITPYLRNGELVNAEAPNSIRFESFLFDVLPYATNPVVLETTRAEEFAPLKNSAGPNSPDTCQRAMMEEWARWLETAGVALPRNSEHEINMKLEISPLFATSAKELRARLNGDNLTLHDPLLLE
ncbi:MAG: UTP--glucose-1-phosphate uridylyltransferase, partial [Planctomycetota bacterium]